MVKVTRHNPDGGKRRRLLYVGMRTGGDSPQNADIIAAIRKLARAGSELCLAPGPDDLSIDLVFDVPGPILGVDYEGIRTGRLWPPMRMLQIQVAVPADLSNADIHRFLAEMLGRTAIVVREFMTPRKTGLSTERVEAVLRDLAERVEG